jgi:dCTP deaminase
MILTCDVIRQEIEAGRVVIDPFLADQVGPASIDLHLGDEIRVMHTGREPVPVTDDVDYRTISDVRSLQTPYPLAPGETIHGITRERITLPGDIGGWLEGRSRFARLGLMIHVTSGFVQPSVSSRRCSRCRTCPGGRWSSRGRASHSSRLQRCETARRTRPVRRQNNCGGHPTSGSRPLTIVPRRRRGRRRDAVPDWASAFGTVHGGAISMFCDTALAVAIAPLRTRRPDRDAPAHDLVRVVHHRARCAVTRSSRADLTVAIAEAGPRRGGRLVARPSARSRGSVRRRTRPDAPPAALASPTSLPAATGQWPNGTMAPVRL